MVIIKNLSLFTYMGAIQRKMPAYTSPKAMTIAEIIKVIDSEGTLEIGINEMPDKRWF